MKVLYGVQATGQGHISRARAMARALARHNTEITWLFSGRPRARLFDMEPFGEFLHRRGLTFHTRNGNINHFATIIENSIPKFIQDVRRLDVTPYDLVITDFEPVTAWAGRINGIATVGIGHQYAFGGDTPRPEWHFFSRQLLHRFAPAVADIGLHWHPYQSHIVPPILDLPALEPEDSEHILVYLPFEDQNHVTRLLQHFPQFHFRQYAAALENERCGNVLRHRANIHGFKQDLWTCRGVICNSGFELISECLQWRKPVLSKPLLGQMEQLANALALEELGYARIMRQLNHENLGAWLGSEPAAPQITFPDVAGALADWIAGGCTTSRAELSRRLWSQVQETSDAQTTTEARLPCPPAGYGVMPVNAPRP